MLPRLWGLWELFQRKGESKRSRCTLHVGGVNYTNTPHCRLYKVKAKGQYTQYVVGSKNLTYCVFLQLFSQWYTIHYKKSYLTFDLYCWLARIMAKHHLHYFKMSFFFFFLEGNLFLNCFKTWQWQSEYGHRLFRPAVRHITHSVQPLSLYSSLNDGHESWCKRGGE